MRYFKKITKSQSGNTTFSSLALYEMVTSKCVIDIMWSFSHDWILQNEKKVSEWIINWCIESKPQTNDGNKDINQTHIIIATLCSLDRMHVQCEIRSMNHEKLLYLHILWISIMDLMFYLYILIEWNSNHLLMRCTILIHQRLSFNRESHFIFHFFTLRRFFQIKYVFIRHLNGFCVVQNGFYCNLVWVTTTLQYNYIKSRLWLEQKIQYYNKRSMHRIDCLVFYFPFFFQLSSIYELKMQ